MAWKKVMVITRLPSIFMLESLNSPPMEKAMKPSATVEMISMDLSTPEGTSPRQLGPISRPATR